MPELPEVETMVRGVRADLVGRRILGASFCRCCCRPIQVVPGRSRFRRALTDRVIQDVRRLAKRIVISLDQSGHLVIEPRMTGLLLISSPPTPEHRRIQWDLEPRPGLASSFEFWDRRGLGTVQLLDAQQLKQLQDRLGPDPLEMSAADWAMQLNRTQRPVKNAMLDQSLVVGIGNIYASEILHLARVSPEASASSLSTRRISRIAAAAGRILRDAIRYEGSTLGDGTYRNALNRDGSYQNKHRVYDKAGELCSTCRRSRIRRIVQAQRSTFFCPRCQRS